MPVAACPPREGPRPVGQGLPRHRNSCNAKITRWRRRRVDGDGNDGWGEKLSKWEVAKEPIRHLAPLTQLTHSLARQGKEKKGRGSREMNRTLDNDSDRHIVAQFGHNTYAYGRPAYPPCQTQRGLNVELSSFGGKSNDDRS